MPNTEFLYAGTLAELKRDGRLVVRGPHRPILVERGDRVFAWTTAVRTWAFR
jgi:hypothetical protein